jgi:hypothetical protein
MKRTSCAASHKAILRDVVEETVCTSANVRTNTQQHTATKREVSIGGDGLDSSAKGLSLPEIRGCHV